MKVARADRLYGCPVGTSSPGVVPDEKIEQVLCYKFPLNVSAYINDRVGFDLVDPPQDSHFLWGNHTGVALNDPADRFQVRYDIISRQVPVWKFINIAVRQ